MLVRLVSTWLRPVFALTLLSIPLSGQGGEKHLGGHRQVPVCREYDYGRQDLFYNFFVPPTCGGVGAALYPAPLTTVPPHVGYTYYTYQPLMPHEMLYKHHRSYHRYYNEGRGLTRTSVHWR
jgi:hypothetical protein